MSDQEKPGFVDAYHSTLPQSRSGQGRAGQGRMQASRAPEVSWFLGGGWAWLWTRFKPVFGLSKCICRTALAGPRLQRCFDKMELSDGIHLTSMLFHVLLQSLHTKLNSSNTEAVQVCCPSLRWLLVTRPHELLRFARIETSFVMRCEYPLCNTACHSHGHACTLLSFTFRPGQLR